MKFNKINNIGGWLVFAIALVVYILTLEPSVSLWDCGEFISCAYRQQVAHPPGATFFLILGRFFTLFATPETNEVAIAVNMMSATASAATVMFAFWIITHLGKKTIGLDVNDNDISLPNTISLIGAGLVGSLALTFMDTFWFSAVEAEVYATSSAFTFLAFWGILRWEKVKDEPKSNRWLIFIAYTMGLGIGVHLLNLLVIPAIIFYYFFVRYPHTRKNILSALGIGVLIIGLLQYLILPRTPQVSAFFDRIFVNSFGLPYNSGSVFFLMLLGVLIAIALIWAKKNNRPILHLALTCYAFIMIGFSSYAMAVIRASAEPAINMNDPQDAYSLLGYINREQYGERPLFRGPHWNARPVGIKEGRTSYTRTKDGYLDIGPKLSYEYEDADKVWFPRMGDPSEKSQLYPYWAGMTDVSYKLNELRQRIQQEPGNEQLRQELAQVEARQPTYAQNMRFMFNYQFGFMYWRYFMWNFAGRQNDFHNITGNITEGNWLSGINFIDEMRLGPQDNLPSSIAHNKARNKYYFLPLILGLLGVFYHYKKRPYDFYTVLVMFLFTGLIMIFYLNQPPMEPRERDYASVCSFQTFCLWIGFGVLALGQFIKRWMSPTVAASLATVIGLLGAPVLMGSQNWDDHDRSDRYLGMSFAKNYLNSCAENAILFTNGDNDTYPLWYAQNVEGYRTDVRIINLSLLPTEWYSNALRKKVFDSEPLPLSIPAEKMISGTREYISFQQNPKFDQNLHYKLSDVVDWVASDDANKKTMIRGELMNYLPVNRFNVDVDKDAVKASGIVPEKDFDKIEDKIQWQISKSGLNKGELVVLDIIATNAKEGWKRPIYWTTTTGNSVYLNLDNYLRHNGLTYQLLPVKANRAVRGMDDLDMLYDKLMNVYEWGNMEKGTLWLDEKATLVPKNLQSMFIQVADMMSRQNQHDSAVNLINKAFESIPESVMPMNLNLKAACAEILYKADKLEDGDKLMIEVVKEASDLVSYYKRFKKIKQKQEVGQDMRENLRIIQQAISSVKMYGRSELENSFEATFNKLNTML
jgi:hypothetical protein